MRCDSHSRRELVDLTIGIFFLSESQYEVLFILALFCHSNPHSDSMGDAQSLVCFRHYFVQATNIVERRCQLTLPIVVDFNVAVLLRKLSACMILHHQVQTA